MCCILCAAPVLCLPVLYPTFVSFLLALSHDLHFPTPPAREKHGKLERELADEMNGHAVNGIAAETPPTHRPLVLAKTAEGETPLMAAAGSPSPSCVELVRLKEREGGAEASSSALKC